MTALMLVLAAMCACRCGVDAQHCMESDYALLPANQTRDQDVYLAGLFSVHHASSTGHMCADVSAAGVQHLEAFLWAVQTFKARHPRKLEGISLGALGFDNCAMAERGLQHFLNLVTCEQSYGLPPIDPDHVFAYVGPGSDDGAVLLSPTLSRMRRTAISPMAASIHLRDMRDSGYLLRTVPSNQLQVEAIVSLLAREEWRFVQVVRGTGASNTEMYNAFIISTQQHTCVVNTVSMPGTSTRSQFTDAAIAVRNNPNTKVVLLIMSTEETQFFLSAMHATGQHSFIWIATSSWGVNPDVIRGNGSVVEDAITLQLENNNDQQFTRDFVSHFVSLNTGDTSNPWFAEYAQLNENLVLDTYVPYVISAVDAALLGIDTAIRKMCNTPLALCTNLMSDANKWVILHDHIRSGGRFDSAGDVLDGYLTINRVTTGVSGYRYDQVGYYTSNTLNIRRNLPSVSTTCASSCGMCPQSTTLPVSTPLQRFTFDATEPSILATPSVEMREGVWVIVLIVLASVGISFVLLFEIVLMCKLSTSAVDFKRIWLGQMLLLAIFLSYLCLYAFVAAPTDATCGIIRFAIGTCYALIFSILLVKLMILLSSESVGSLKGIFQVLMFIFTFGVQLAIEIEWLLLREPEAKYMENEHAWMCSQGFDSHVTSLSYVMFLLIVCTILAAKSKGIVTNHRESLLILICCCLIIPIFLVWLLVGFLVDDREYEDPCLAYGLFATATVVLLVMFLPKIRQLNRSGADQGNSKLSEADSHREYVASMISQTVPIEVMTNHNKAYSVTGSVKPSHMTPPIVFVDDVNHVLYSEPMDVKPAAKKDPDALYLRHPGGTLQRLDTASVRSVPVSYAPRTSQPPPTSVLHVTSDLLGSGPYERKARSEANLPIGYGTTRSTPSARSVTSARSTHSARSAQPGYYSLSRPRSIKDLGSL